MDICCYEYEVIDVYKYDDIVTKLIINSLYGFFGIKYMDIDAYKIIKCKNKKDKRNDLY